MRPTGTENLLLFGSAAILTLLLNPIFRDIALKNQILDTPNSERKIQRTAVPYLGGFAVMISVFVVVFSAISIKFPEKDFFLLAAQILLPALLLGLVGYVDDVRHLGATSRFIAQFGAGIFTAVILINSKTVGNSFNNSLVDSVLTVIWIVGIANAINFLDNMDGAAGAVAAICSFGFFVASIQSGQYLVGSQALVLSGACVGYLKLNWNPAKIYMGDAGALFIGVLLAALAVRLNPRELDQPISFVVPILLLAIPILDTTLVVIDRVRRNVNPFEGGLDHISHRLRRRGYSTRKTVIIMSTLQTFFTLFALSLLKVTHVYQTILSCFAGVILMLIFMFFLKQESVGNIG